MLNYIIVGTGPAAIAAAEAIRQKDKNANITLIGEEKHGFYSRPGLAYYLSGEISERQLFLRKAESFNHLKTRAVALHPEAHQLVTEDGCVHPFDRLLLATGSTATRLSIPGSDLDGVLTLDNLEDARGMISMSRISKSAVVVGGGITALEIVEALVTRGVKTHYLLRSDRYWPCVLDEVESAIVEKRLKERGVQLYCQAPLSRIIGKDHRISAVEAAGGEKIGCQLLAVAIGVQPRTELAASAGLRTERGILTDEFLQTSASDVYAAGDVVQAFDISSGKSVLDTLWRKAVVQGQVAGRNMAGEHIPYHTGVPFNVTRLAGLTTTIIGSVGQGDNRDKDLLSIARGDSETWRQIPQVMAVQWDFKVNRTRVMVGRSSIVGAVVMGDQTLSRPLHELIAGKVDITPIRHRLFLPGAPLADIILEFWLEWSHNHEKLPK